MKIRVKSIYKEATRYRLPFSYGCAHYSGTGIQSLLTPQFCLQTAVKEQIDLQCLIKFQLPLKPLAKFEGNVKNEKQTGILFNAVDYLELVGYTGRIVKEGKRGVINQLAPPILKRLTLNTDEWLARSCCF